ncbi:thioesterase domain-containing protein [Streptomyces sp. NPDC092370]|uniref:thioesterase domain-containing protein n=1 Tax=Streptomyces sp. NPDC092370 TaxID=3366016 RepID=UPI00380F84F2
MRQVQPHWPYRLLGWSYGGFVTHALARALRRDGEHVEVPPCSTHPQPHGTAHDADAAHAREAREVTRLIDQGIIDPVPDFRSRGDRPRPPAHP